MDFPIGIMVDSLRLPIGEGLRRAAALGAEGVQIAAVGGDYSGSFTPTNLSAERRREYRSLLEGLGLRVSALCGDPGGHGFSIPGEIDERVEEAKRVMELALDLDCRVVTTHIGVIPPDPSHPRRAVMSDACARLGEIGESLGGRFAIETGPEIPSVLADFLDRLGSKGIGVNYDPANLVMVTNSDPVAGVETLGRHIVHTHAKDGLCLKPSDPEVVYGFFADGGIGDLRLGDCFLETPLGEGAVDFSRWLAALRKIGYTGFLTIEREVGDNPEADIQKAVAFLKTIRSTPER